MVWTPRRLRTFRRPAGEAADIFLYFRVPRGHQPSPAYVSVERSRQTVPVSADTTRIVPCRGQAAKGHRYKSNNL
jgi:hypothetical protein